MSTIYSELNGAMGVDLVEAITSLEVHQPPINELLPWNEAGIETLSARIEYAGDSIHLIANQPRGGVADTLAPVDNKFIQFDALHLPVRDVVYADASLIRPPGRTSGTTAEALRNEALTRMKRSLMWTNANLRLGALMGKLLDADGVTELVDLFAAFGLSQQTHTVDFDDASTNVLNEIIAAQRKSRAALDGFTPTEGWLALCSPGFLDALRASPSYEKLAVAATPGRMLGGTAKIEIDSTDLIEFTTPGNFPGIADGEALLCPRMPDLYISRFAPGDYTDAVGTLGVPYYVKAELMPFQKGYNLEGQSNPINVVTRPRSVVRLIAE